MPTSKIFTSGCLPSPLPTILRDRLCDIFCTENVCLFSTCHKVWVLNKDIVLRMSVHAWLPTSSACSPWMKRTKAPDLKFHIVERIGMPSRTSQIWMPPSLVATANMAPVLESAPLVLKAGQGRVTPQQDKHKHWTWNIKPFSSRQSICIPNSKDNRSMSSCLARSFQRSHTWLVTHRPQEVPSVSLEETRQ